MSSFAKQFRGLQPQSTLLVWQNSGSQQQAAKFEWCHPYRGQHFHFFVKIWNFPWHHFSGALANSYLHSVFIKVDCEYCKDGGLYILQGLNPQVPIQWDKEVVDYSNGWSETWPVFSVEHLTLDLSHPLTNKGFISGTGWMINKFSLLM